MIGISVMGLLFGPVVLTSALTLPAGAAALFLPVPVPGAVILVGAGLI